MLQAAGHDMGEYHCVPRDLYQAPDAVVAVTACPRRELPLLVDVAPAATLVAVLERGVPEDYIAALAAGAHGALSIAARPAALLDVLGAAHTRRVLLPGDIAVAIARQAESARPVPVIRRQITLLRCLRDGRTTPEIAAQLRTTTVDAARRLRTLYSELGVAGRDDAAHLARALPIDAFEPISGADEY